MKINNYCPDCNQSTSCRCPKHSLSRFEFSVPIQITTPTCIITSTPPKPCLICKKESYFSTTLPYGSKFDGEEICSDCIEKYFDSVIENLIKEK